MSQFLSQLPALLGVIIGAGASYIATSARERSSWVRSQRVRWEDKRAQVYADYGHAVKTVYELSKRVAATRGMPTKSAPLPLESGLEDLRQAAIGRSEVWERLLLVGDPDTVAAARIWHRVLWEMQAFAEGRRSAPDEWKAVNRAFRAARLRFYEAARHDLGITSGRLPE